VERTPGAGRHANLSAGVASAKAINGWETCFHSPSYPSQMPSGADWANNSGVLNENNTSICANSLFTARLFSYA